MLSPAAINLVPAPMRPPMANMPPPASLACWAWIRACAPGSLSTTACTLSGGPSLTRKSRMMPTAFSATALSTPTLATRRAINSSMIPSTLPHWRRVVAILNVVRGDDKHVALSHAQSCRCAHTLSRLHVKQNVTRLVSRATLLAIVRARLGAQTVDRKVIRQYHRQYPQNYDQSYFEVGQGLRRAMLYKF